MCGKGEAAQFHKYDLEIWYFKMAKTTEDIFFQQRKNSCDTRQLSQCSLYGSERHWTYFICSRDSVKLTASNYGKKYLVLQQRQISLSSDTPQADNHKNLSTDWVTTYIADIL